MPARIEHSINEIIETNKILSNPIKKNNRLYYTVECLNCGCVREVRADNLKQKCRACAAKTRTPKIIDDLTGKVFGYWVVIEKAKKPNYWHCKCKCGTEKDVFRGNLTQGMSKSCGCINSWGEEQICYWLNTYQIPYQKEYLNKELKTSNNGYYRFDSAIFKNNNIVCLIEFDGRQHYYFDENWKMSKKDFLKRQNADKEKTKYCIKNSIPLYRFNEKTNLQEEILKIKNLYFKGNN